MLKEQGLTTCPIDAGIDEKKSTETANLSEATSQRPVLYIDRDEKIINADGQVRRFSKEATVTWGVLLFLTRQSKPVSNTDIKRSSREGRSLNSISTLRTLIDKNREGPRMLKRFGWKETSTYLLDADVRFIDKSHPDWGEIFAVSKEDQKMLPGERQSKAMLVFFALNKDKTAFREESTAAVVKAIYSEKFSGELDSEQTRAISKRCSYTFKHLQGLIISMLRKSETMPSEKWSPTMAELINWLRAQPEYAKASVEDLILAVKRKISFEELKRRTALSSSIPAASKDGNSAKSAPVASATAVEVGAQAVNTPADDNSEEETTASPYRLTFQELLLLSYFVLFSAINNRALFISLKIPQSEEQGINLKKFGQAMAERVRSEGAATRLNDSHLASLRSKLAILTERPEAFMKVNKGNIALDILYSLDRRQLMEFLPKVVPVKMAHIKRSFDGYRAEEE